MRHEVQGLRTCIYKVPDLVAAKEWYSKAFDSTPYFDEPFYVGFNIGGYELGLQPLQPDSDIASGSVYTYWGVEDIRISMDHMISLAATEHGAITNVGGEIEVASVNDPWGNIIGLIYNPTFKLD